MIKDRWPAHDFFEATHFLRESHGAEEARDAQWHAGLGYRPACSEEQLCTLTAGRHPDCGPGGLTAGGCYLAQLQTLQQSCATYTG